MSQTKTLREKFPYLEFIWSVISRIRTEYGEILRKSLYSIQMRENTGQKNSKYGLFTRWELLQKIRNKNLN